MIKVVAQFVFKADKVGEALEHIKELVAETRKENGCISYEVFQRKGKPNFLTFIEEWESQETLDVHAKAPHFTAIVPKLRELTEQDTVITAYEKVM